jgi:4-amino-4-deoxy-L-arabinose transferase-like glycosyltransferase
MVGSLIGVSLIVERLKRTSRAALLSAVVAATVPMGVLQASSTQNDYVVTFWLVCAAYSILTTMDAGSMPLSHAAAIGVASGLAILTKGTAYVYLLPFLGWFGLNRNVCFR